MVFSDMLPSHLENFLYKVTTGIAREVAVALEFLGGRGEFLDNSACG